MKKPKNEIKAVIFDMDGLIVDTEIVESRSLELILSEYGKKPKPFKNGLLHIIGGSGNQSYSDIMKKYNFNEDVDIFKKRKREIFEELLRVKLEPLPGFTKLITLLKKQGFKIALASNRYEKHIYLILENLGIKNLFDVIVGPSELRRHKPYPDIFLHTANELKVNPYNCVVLEDTDIGVAAAKAAGMKIIAVPNQYTKEHDFSKADIVTKSLENVTITMLKSL